MPPAPGGSVVPRANTTSMSGHGSAPVAGRTIDDIGSAQAAAATTATMRVIRYKAETSMLICRASTPRGIVEAGYDAAVRRPVRRATRAEGRRTERRAAHGGAE